MPVRCVNEKFICSVCGNEVVVIKVGGGTIYCCGTEMQSKGVTENTIVRREESTQ